MNYHSCVYIHFSTSVSHPVGIWKLRNTPVQNQLQWKRNPYNAGDRRPIHKVTLKYDERAGGHHDLA